MSSPKAENSSTIWKPIEKQKRVNGLDPGPRSGSKTATVFIDWGCDIERDRGIREKEVERIQEELLQGIVTPPLVREASTATRIEFLTTEYAQMVP